MSELETVKLTRSIKAILVPFGNEIDVPEGTEAIILQALGGTYTIVAGGQTLRVESIYADALGKQESSVDAYINDANVPLIEKIWTQLRNCYDPEIPVNIVDLGLIYDVSVMPLSESAAVSNNNNAEVIDNPAAIAQVEAIDEYKAIIRMTLTAPGCGMGPIIAGEAKQKVLAIPKIKAVTIIIAFDPPWDRSRLSAEAKLALGLM